MGGEPREKGVSYSGEVMVVATAEQMALFDEQHLNGDQQMGGDPDAIVYYPGGYATRDELRKMQEAGDGMWRQAGGARQFTAGRRFTKRRKHMNRTRSMKRRSRQRRVSRR
jgi:hypothetical protein